MRETITLLLVAVLMGIPSAAFAEGQQRPTGQAQQGVTMQRKGGMPQQGGMMQHQQGGMMQQQEMMQARGMGGMHGGMMGEKSIVSSNDGGAIVMAGSKLYKYDKNLNLVKEVELPKPEGAMHDAAMAGKKSSGCGCAGGCGAAAAQSAPGAAQK